MLHLSVVGNDPLEQDYRNKALSLEREVDPSVSAIQFMRHYERSGKGWNMEEGRRWDGRCV